jgi:hypothetical protein
MMRHPAMAEGAGTIARAGRAREVLVNGVTAYPGEDRPSFCGMDHPNFRQRDDMAKLLGRFRHVNKGQVIEEGREIEFRIEMKSGDLVTVQMTLAEVPVLVRFLENLALKAAED